MHPLVLPGHGADGAQCRKGGHHDLSDGGETLWGELPAAPEQPPIGIIGPDQDGEEQVKDMRSSVPVHPQERQLRQPRDWGRLGCEAAQKRMEPPPF